MKKRTLTFLIVFIVLVSSCVTVSFCDSTGTKTHDDFKGKKITVTTGATFDGAVKEFLDSPDIQYFNNVADQMEAILKGKADAMVMDELQYYYMQQNGELDDFEMIMGMPGIMNYAMFFSKDSRGAAMKAEIDDFIKEIRADGRLDKILNHWLKGEETDLVIPSLSELTGENGTLKVATAAIFPPFNFIEKGEVVGYEPDILRLFAKEKGYKLEYHDMTYDSTLVGVAAGKFDIGSSGSCVTEERLKSLNYSEVIYSAGCVVVYPKESESSVNGSITESFRRTFIEDGRWKLFANGVGSTMLITVLSMVFGTLLGFLVFLLCRRGNRFANGITKGVIWLIQGIPMVVFLMLLFYIVFGKTSFGGIWVAVIGFTLTFGASVFQMIDAGVRTVDSGQIEAAYSIGYSDIQTFFKIVLPQAAQHFMGIFRTEAVFHLKATAIVGYIAVRDLTKVSDIVRSITYEPFFPLIATAVIYIVLGTVLSAVVKRIQTKIDPMKKNREAFLKGVER